MCARRLRDSSDAHWNIAGCVSCHSIFAHTGIKQCAPWADIYWRTLESFSVRSINDHVIWWRRVFKNHQTPNGRASHLPPSITTSSVSEYRMLRMIVADFYPSDRKSTDHHGEASSSTEGLYRDPGDGETDRRVLGDGE